MTVSDNGGSDVTQWRQWQTWRQLAAVADDHLSSATTLGGRSAHAVAALLTGVMHYDPALYPDAVLDAVDYLAARHPTVAPVANLQNAVSLAVDDGPETVERVTEEMVARFERTMNELSREGAALIESGATVMVHSSSSSVRAALDLAFKERDFRVVCTEALPMGEGRELAAELAEAGFEVELLSDDEAIEFIAGMDGLFVGADAIGPGRAINKVGTCALAEAGSDAGVPVYLVASEDKVLPEELFDRAVRLSAVGGPGVGGLAEVVPLSWFTSVVTEHGPLEPGEVSRLATERPVARRLR